MFNEIETADFLSTDKWLDIQDFKKQRKVNDQIKNYTRPLKDIAWTKQ